MLWGGVEFSRTQRRKEAKGNVAKKGLETINVTPLMVEKQRERTNLQNGIQVSLKDAEGKERGTNAGHGIQRKTEGGVESTGISIPSVQKRTPQALARCSFVQSINGPGTRRNHANSPKTTVYTGGRMLERFRSSPK